MSPRKIIFLSVLIVMLLVQAFAVDPAGASPTGDAVNDRAVVDFPNTITFQVELRAASPIQSVVLEYGDRQETCGEVVAKAYPEITPAKTIQAEWTWDMRQSGSLPPGSTIWWRWRYTDENGPETVTDEKTTVWLDNVHGWQSLSKGDVRLHWYRNSQGFAQQLLDAADKGLARVETEAGLTSDVPIDLYIYASNQDMQDAILYEPSWTGGQAFPGQNIVMIGIQPSELDWGRKAEVHELTHVVVGHFTFTCLGDVPTWLNEGLAVYSEGELDPASQTQLDEAIQDDTLLTVRSLSGGFSEVPSKAYLSYSESYSIVKVLIEEYGRDKMNALLIALRDGNTIDEALTSVYGLDVEGLEDLWRARIGARERPAVPNPTAIPSPTFVPTIIPISGELPAITPTPFTAVTSAPTIISADRFDRPPLLLTIVLLITCCTLSLVVGVVILGFVLTLRNKKGGDNETRS